MAVDEVPFVDVTHMAMTLAEGPVSVEVRNRFAGTWSHGFEIVEYLVHEDHGPMFRLRRVSDGCVLPALFAADDIIARRY